MADVSKPLEQPRNKRALRKENSLGTRNLEAAVQWSPEIFYGADWHSDLKRFQPTIVKVVQHEYSQLPKKLTEEPLLLHSVASHRKVIAYRAPASTTITGSEVSGSSTGSAGGSGPKVSRGGSLATTVDSATVAAAAAARLYHRQASDEQLQRFSIPLAYEGWFEILSEDGQAALPFNRVAQLADASPRAFLVREKCKAYYYSDESSSVAGREPAPDKSRTVHPGELMAVVGATTAVLGWRHRRKRSLHCLDESGAAVFFDCDQRGSFSPVAPASGADVIGVHRISTIAEAFRMPITVRSVGGLRARAGAAGPGAPGCFRLTEVRTDEVALLLPLRTGGSLVPVSARTHLRVVAAGNRDELLSRDDFAALYRSCSSKAEAYFKTIQVLVSTDRRRGGGSGSVGSSVSDDRPVSGGSGSERYSRSFSHEEDYVPPPPRLPLPPTPPSHQRALSSSSSFNDDDERGDSPEQPGNDAGSGSQATSEENILFDEVDDLYDYVRRGGEPPKPRPRSWANQGTIAPGADAASGGSSSDGRRPQPPPESRRLDDDGRSSSQPILSSNGVLRGRLAELTSGRFPRHASRSSPAVAVAALTVVQPDASAAVSATAAAEPAGGLASCVRLEPPTLPWAPATPGDSSNDRTAAEGSQKRSSDGECGSERDYNDYDDRRSLPAGGTGGSESLASAGSITSTHSQAHLRSSATDLAGVGSDDSALAAATAAADSRVSIFVSESSMLPRLLLSASSPAAADMLSDDELRVHAQLQLPPRSSPLLTVTSDGDSNSTAMSDDMQESRLLSSLSLTTAAGSTTDGPDPENAEASPDGAAASAAWSPNEWHGSTCSTPESGTAFWSCRSSPPPPPQIRSMERLRVPLMSPSPRGFDTIRADGRRCVSGASSPLTLTPQRHIRVESSLAAAGGHDGHYATLSHPSAAGAVRQRTRASAAAAPCRSTGDLVRLFEQLTGGSSAAVESDGSSAAANSGAGSGTLLTSVLTLRRRGSRPAVLSESQLPTHTPPSEPEDFETGNSKTMSDSIRRRITTLKLSARALMV